MKKSIILIICTIITIVGFGSKAILKNSVDDEISTNEDIEL